MSGNTSLDDNKAEFVIASCPGIRFTAWFDPDRDWLSVEGRDESGMLRGVGCRMSAAEFSPPLNQASDIAATPILETSPEAEPANPLSAVVAHAELGGGED